MNANSARRARQKALQTDLTRAYSDDEAVPPEWVDLLNTVRDETKALRADVERETHRFVNDPDIKGALERRSRFEASARKRTAAVNRMTSRLNLIAPHARFTRAALAVDELLRPLFRSPRNAG